MGNSNAKHKSLSKRKSHHRKVPYLEQINMNACGIDIGSRSHFVAVPHDRDNKSVREFFTFTDDLYELADWLTNCKITTVAMESTGVYWIPVYEILVEKGFEVKLVDARHVKNVSGRKSDVLDCQWIQQLHTFGLLNGAFIPELRVCALRTYVNQREQLIREAGTYVQRMQKAMIQMNIQLHNVVTDITGVTGMKIIRDILSGERNPVKLAKNRDHRCKSTEEIIAKSLRGNFREEHLFSLRQAVTFYDMYHKQIKLCDVEIEKAISQFNPEVDIDSYQIQEKKKASSKASKHAPEFDARRALIQMTGIDLTLIPGIESSTALRVISVIGKDVSAWKSEKHFTSWLGLAPGTKVSGGKKLSGSSKRSSNKAAHALRLAAQTLSRSKTALGAYYRRLRARISAPKAITAAARKLAEILYFMLKQKREYVEVGQTYYEERYQERLIRSLKRKAAQLGLELKTPESCHKSQDDGLILAIKS